MECLYGMYYGDVTSGGFAHGFGCIVYYYIAQHRDGEYSIVARNNEKEYAFFIGHFVNGMPEDGSECTCSLTGLGNKEDYATIIDLMQKYKNKYGQHRKKPIPAIVFQSRRTTKKALEKKTSSTTDVFGIDINPSHLRIRGIWSGNTFKGKCKAATTIGDFTGEISDLGDTGEFICDKYTSVGIVFRDNRYREFQGTVYYHNGDRFIGYQYKEKPSDTCDSGFDEDETTYMQGTYYYANGDVYVGRLNVDEMRDGFGILTRKNEEICGFWESNELID